MRPKICTRVPAWVLEHEAVSGREVALAWAVWSFSDHPGDTVHPSQKALVRASRLSERGVRRGLAVLALIGAIRDTGRRVGRGVIVFELADEEPLAITTPARVAGQGDRGQGDRPTGPGRPARVTGQTGQGDRADRPTWPTEETREETTEGTKEETTGGTSNSQLSLVGEDHAPKAPSKAEIVSTVLSWFVEQRLDVARKIGKQAQRLGITDVNRRDGLKTLERIAERLCLSPEKAAAAWCRIIRAFVLTPALKDPKAWRWVTIEGVSKWSRVERPLEWYAQADASALDRSAAEAERLAVAKREDRAKAEAIKRRAVAEDQRRKLELKPKGPSKPGVSFEDAFGKD